MYDGWFDILILTPLMQLFHDFGLWALAIIVGALVVMTILARFLLGERR